MEELAKRGREWAASDAGRKALAKILADSVRAQIAAAEARHVDPATLRKAVDF